jgi:hypothetical protein
MGPSPIVKFEVSTVFGGFKKAGVETGIVLTIQAP